MPPQEANFVLREPTMPPRRQSVSAPSSPVATIPCAGDLAFYHSPQPLPRQLHRAKKVYESPLVDHVSNRSMQQRLQTHEARWKYMSTLAGKHKQDAGTLFINPLRVSTPSALQAGMMKQAALRVTTLHLPILSSDQLEDDDSITKLPAWLDAVVATFPNLRHLHLQQTRPSELDSSKDGPADDDRKDPSNKYSAMASSLRPEKEGSPFLSSDKGKADEIKAVHRLYVLYRIVGLETLDDQPFSEQEREFASFRNRQQRSSNTSSSDVDKDWAEQADAKMTANSVSKAAETLCLMDNGDDDNDDEENEDPRHCSPLPLPKRLGSDLEVEVDVFGRPQCTPGRIVSNRRSSSGEDHVIRSPPRLTDEDRWEYESVESSAACEWTAACGAISLPYFRKLPTVSNRERAKSKFQLKLKRRSHSAEASTRLSQYTYDAFPEEVSESVEASPRLGHHHDSQGGSAPCIVMLSSQYMHARDSATQRQPSQSSSPRSTSSQGSSCAFNQRLSASQSLSSPFPLQFRSRASTTVGEDDSRLAQDVASTEAKQELKILTEFAEISDHASCRVPPPPRDTAMETIEVPIALTRTQSSPSKLPSIRSRLTPSHLLAKSKLPPPCPGPRRTIQNSTSMATPRISSAFNDSSRKERKRGKNWREKMSARSTSIMDDDDENSNASSDEDQIVIEPKLI
jgi:hypothetical protein